jgi:MFS family permease
MGDSPAANAAPAPVASLADYYTGFAVIFARISDGIGRKAACIVAWVFFAGFSLGAGLSQSMSQLIAFRTLQGIGGSGLFSLCMIVLPQITPVRLWGLMSGLVGTAFVCSYVLGIYFRPSYWEWMANNNRTYPWRHHHAQCNMAVDIFIQCPRCRHWGRSHIVSLA